MFPAAAAGRGKVAAKVAWLASNPDLFDAYSIGLILLATGVPYMRSGDRMRRLKACLTADVDAEGLQQWRDRLPEVAQKDFALLDAQKGAGWELVCGLVAPRERRTSVEAALRHRFCREKR